MFEFFSLGNVLKGSVKIRTGIEVSFTGTSVKDQQTFQFWIFPYNNKDTWRHCQLKRACWDQTSLRLLTYCCFNLFKPRKKRRSICFLWTTWKCEMLRRASCLANISSHCLTRSRGKKTCHPADAPVKLYLAENFNIWECSSGISTALSELRSWYSWFICCFAIA